MPITISDKRKQDLLNCFIKNPTFYSSSDNKNVRKVISNYYYNDYEVIRDISKTNEVRTLLGSESLLNRIITEIFKKNYIYISENTYEDILFIISCLNKFEETHYTQDLYVNSLTFINYVISLLDEEIVKKELYDGYKDELSEFYTFFKRVIEKVKLSENIEINKYESIYTNQVKRFFSHNSFQYSSIWFKYYFLYYYNSKDKPARKNEVIDTIANQFIRKSKNPIQLMDNISEVIGFKEFMALESTFFNEIYNLCKTQPQFALEYYQSFDDEKKQGLLESYIPKNNIESPEDLKEILEGIEFNVPDKVVLINKVLVATNRITNVDNRRKLYNICVKVDFGGDMGNIAEYSNQVISIICGTNVALHELGIDEFENKGKFINNKTLKEKAIDFLLSILVNLNAYHKIFSNILNLKIGIDKRRFDAELNRKASNIVYINNFIVGSGNINFYEAITSKVKDDTIKIINDHFVRVISYHGKYESIIAKINKCKTLLSDELHDKLSQLIANE